MKKLSLLLVLLLTISAFSQKKHHQKPDFTVEQKTELMIKKMTLALDLNKKQISQITPLVVSKVKERDAKKSEHKGQSGKMSNDEVFNKMSQRLDKMIALSAQMKKILDDDQYAKWKKMSAKHMHKKKHGKKKHGKKKGCDGKKCDGEKRKRHHEQEEV